MGRRLRFVPEGALVEITCRAVQGRMLFRPSAALNEIVLGVLGRALELHPVDLHQVVFLSNHYHLLVSPGSAQRLALFMAYLNTNLSKEVGRLHAWRGALFERRYQSILVSDEPGAQIDRLTYLIAQGSKEGLVASPRDWPGVQGASALTDGSSLEGVWYDRTREWAARERRQRDQECSFATRYCFHLAPLPCWRHLRQETWRSRVAEIVDAVEEEARRSHRRAGTRPLGMAAILKVHPHQRPKRVKCSPAPLVHAASRKARKEWLHAYGEFFGSFRRAIEHLKTGLPASFPEGSFLPPILWRIGPIDFSPG